MPDVTRRSALALAWATPVVATVIAVPSTSASQGCEIRVVSVPSPLIPGTEQSHGEIVLQPTTCSTSPGEIVTVDLPIGFYHAETFARTMTTPIGPDGLVRLPIVLTPLVGPGTHLAVASTASATVAVPLVVQTRAEPIRLMPFGDSITEGDGSGRLTANAGYRYQFQRAMRDARVEVDMVGSLRNGNAAIVDPDHEGHRGWTSGQLLSRCDAWFVSARPETVVIHAGTNDAFFNNDPDGAGGRVMSIISLLHARFPHAVVLVAKIIPSLSANVQSRVERVNRSIEAAVPANDERIKLVDCSHLLAAEHYVDNLHPNDSGYLVLGETLANAVLSISPRGRI
ncbi:MULTISPECIES: SGNH/GDSL hydrolase family protein [Bacteria]|uniref:SGNH/GDSL hydrolase family protein n=1 Tax=Bacteria TaxID=2 RepID=UPI003C7C3550